MKWSSFIILLLTCRSLAFGFCTVNLDCVGSNDACHIPHCTAGACMNDSPGPDHFVLCTQNGMSVACCTGNLNVTMSGSDCSASPCAPPPPPPCLGNGTICFTSSCANCCSGYSDISGVCQAIPPPPPLGCPNPGETNPHTACQGVLQCTLLSSCGITNCAVASDCGPPPPPPPPSGCGSGIICGQIKDAETNSVLLPGIPFTLRSATGRILRTSFTDTNGQFAFSNLTAPKYIIAPENDRLTCGVPGQKYIAPGDASANFEMRGIKATITIPGKQGTFVIATNNPIALGSPPPDVVAGGSIASISAVIDSNAIGILRVPYGHWYLSCWLPGSLLTSSVQTASIDLGVLKAMDTQTVACQ